MIQLALRVPDLTREAPLGTGILWAEFSGRNAARKRGPQMEPLQLYCISAILFTCLRKKMKPIVRIPHLAILITQSLSFRHRPQRDPKRSKVGPYRSMMTSKSDEVLRVTTNLVTIPVSVRSDDGTYLFDLRKEQFRIYEDGVEQEIGHFSSVEQPFYVVLLIDTSSSTESNLGEIKEAVHAFIAQLRQRDAVLPVLFAGQLIPLLAKATSNRTSCGKGVEKARTDNGNNGTRLYDAVVSLTGFELHPGRKAHHHVHRARRYKEFGDDEDHLV